MILVESICRGLDVLRVVNERANQSLTEICSAVDLPRGTAYRLLVTLEAAGLVERNGSCYRVTQRVCSLSHGFDNDWIEDVASPIVHELGQELHWPVTLSEHYAGCMVIRDNTDTASSLTLDAVRVGTRMSMLDTASGRVLLAYSSPSKQRSLLEYVRASQPTVAPTTAEHFAEVAALIKMRGYDLVPVPNGRQTAIAVPVLNDEGQAVAVLAVRYFNAAMSPDGAIRRLVAPLKAGADRIGRALLARGRSVQ